MIAYYPPSPPCIECLDEGKRVASVEGGLCPFHTGKKIAREAVMEALEGWDNRTPAVGLITGKTFR